MIVAVSTSACQLSLENKTQIICYPQGPSFDYNTTLPPRSDT